MILLPPMFNVPPVILMELGPISILVGPALVMDVIPVKSPSTSTLKVFTPFTSRLDAFVFLPSSISIADLAKFLILVSPFVVILERSVLAIPVILAVMLVSSLPSPST